MKRALITIAALVALVAAVGCGSKQETGTLVGAGVGAATGAAVGGGILGTAIGAVVGGVAGREIAKAMDDDDRSKIEQALDDNEAGETTSWVDDDDDDLRYQFTPRETYGEYQDNDGPCRAFSMRVEMNGELESGDGVACKQDDGSWQVVS